MQSLSKGLIVACALYLSFDIAGAQALPKTSNSYKTSEISQHDFQVGKLKVILKNFDTHYWGAGFIIHAENISSDFVPFSHEDLIAVGSDGFQQNASILFDKRMVAPVKIRIAPAAHVDIPSFFIKKLKLPVKLYLGDEFLTEVKD